MLKRHALLSTLLAAALAACSARTEPQTSERTDQPLNHVLVVQGDALVVNGRHLRLANAATPERIPNARCWAEAIAAREARARLTQLATEVRDIQVQPTGGADEYGRAYARVRFDGLDLGDALVDDGLAVRPSGKPFDWCAPVSKDIAGGPNVAALADLGR